MKQYEYVFQNGKKLYARVFDSETRKSELLSYTVDDYLPDVFIPSTTKTEYVSHANNKQFLKKIEFQDSAQANQYIKDYSKTYNLHGNKNAVMKYTRTEFPDTLSCNHEFRTHFLDIETRSVHGFPDVNNPIEEVSLIQIYDNFEQKYFIFGTQEYYNKKTYLYGGVKYIKCKDEKDLLNKYILLTQKLDPAILIGFNTFLFDFPYLINRIEKLNLGAERLSPVGIIKSKPDSSTKDGIAYTHYDIVGRILMDYRELYLKYTFAKLPKHNLETIATYELGEGKVEHSEHDSFEEFYKKDFQKFVEYGIKDVEILVALDSKLKLINTAKYISYLCGVNIPDVMGTYKQWFSYMYNTCLNNGEILPLEQMYANENDTFIGGWVVSKPGKYDWVVSYDFASLYPNNIRFINISLDTLIPEKDLPEELLNLRKKYFYWYNDPEKENLCKETNNNIEEMEYVKFLIDNKNDINKVLVKYNVCASPNGYFYRKDKEGLFPSLMKYVYNERKRNQKLAKEYSKKFYETKAEEDGNLADMYDLYQYALKILINSVYGSLSMAINTFSHGKGFSCAVTSVGRVSNRWCSYKMCEGQDKLLKRNSDLIKLPYSIQNDTDSSYQNIAGLMYKKGLYPTIEQNIELAQKISEKVMQPFIDAAIDDVAHALNAYDKSVMDMEMETIADKFVSTGDKRYFCRYYKNGKPQFKITGLNIISKSTPPYCKEKLKPVLDIILDNDSQTLMTYIDEVRKDFNNQPVEAISPIKGVSSLEYTWREGKLQSKEQKNGRYLAAPIGSRAAILHNEFVVKNNLNFEHIRGGDKVYLTNLVIPNPVKNNDIVGYSNPRFMEDAKLKKYIDYDALFYKNFKKNVELITTPIGWSLDKYSTGLDDWS